LFSFFFFLPKVVLFLFCRFCSVFVFVFVLRGQRIGKKGGMSDAERREQRAGGGGEKLFFSSSLSSSSSSLLFSKRKRKEKYQPSDQVSI